MKLFSHGTEESKSDLSLLWIIAGILLLRSPTVGMYCDVTTMYTLYSPESTSSSDVHRTGTYVRDIVRPCVTTSNNRRINTPITTYSRSELYALRRQPPRVAYLQALHKEGLLRYRGRRAGTSTRSRRARAGMTPPRFHRFIPIPVFDGNNHLVFQIETITGSRSVRAHHHNKNSRGRNISNLIPIRRLQMIKTHPDGSGSHLSNPAAAGANIEQPPKLYVFNAAALTKPHAAQQLGADLVGMKIDVALICETKLKSKHADACVNIDGYRLFRRDRVGRQGGGVAIYVSERYNATVYSNFEHPSHDTFEIIWVKITTNNSLAFVGALYHPPRPIYAVSDLLDFIEQAIEQISNESPRSPDHPGRRRKSTARNRSSCKNRVLIQSSVSQPEETLASTESTSPSPATQRSRS